MMSSPHWEHCIHHRGDEVTTFADEYFADEQRRVLLIGGAGFDPRSLSVPEQLAACCGDRLLGLFIREERPNANPELRTRADENEFKIREFVSNADILSVEVFDIDDAPVGGRRATKSIHERADFTSITDIVLDCSALSIGLMFPIARYCLETVRRKEWDANFHLIVLDDPQTDSSIQATACGKAAPLHTFSGGLSLDVNNDAAKLWLPQLGTGRREFFDLIFQDVQPHAVCPIIPFPSRNPRSGDALIEEYGDLFEAISDPMTPAWNVDSRDIIYTHENSPLDLYRSILRIDDARTRVFSQTGGSQLVLSPLGSKAVCIGMLMASLERDFSVVSVETIEYSIVDSKPKNGKDAELVHLWLHGEAYIINRDQLQEANHEESKEEKNE